MKNTDKQENKTDKYITLYMREYRKKMTEEKKEAINKAHSQYYKNVWYPKNKDRAKNKVKEWREKQKQNIN